jgi:hypothetical protein
MGASTNNLQYLFELQMQQNNEKNILISKSKTMIFSLNFFEKNFKPL